MKWRFAFLKIHQSSYLNGNKVDSTEPADASMNISCFIQAGSGYPRCLSQASECLHVWLHRQRCASETKSHHSTGIMEWKFSRLGLVCALYPSVVTGRKTENWMAQLSQVARSISLNVLHAWLAEKTEQRWMETRERLISPEVHFTVLLSLFGFTWHVIAANQHSWQLGQIGII